MPIYTEKMFIYTYMQDSHLMVIVSISSNVIFFMLSVQTPAHKMTFFPKSRKLTFMEIFLKECTKKCYKK